MNIEIYDESVADVSALQSLLSPISGMKSIAGFFGFKTVVAMIASYPGKDADILPNIVVLEAVFADGPATSLIPLFRKSRVSKIPIYIYTNSHDEKLLKSCLAAGATQIFHKDPAGSGGKQLAALIAVQTPAPPPEAPSPPDDPARSSNSSPEGYYASLQEAEAHVQRNLDSLKVARQHGPRNLVLNYNFGTATREPLKGFIASMSNHGFKNCVPTCIDEDPDPNDENWRFYWVPYKKPSRITGELLLSEFRKYQSLADVHGVSYGGVTCQVE